MSVGSSHVFFQDSHGSEIKDSMFQEVTMQHLTSVSWTCGTSSGQSMDLPPRLRHDFDIRPVPIDIQ